MRYLLVFLAFFLVGCQAPSKLPQFYVCGTPLGNLQVPDSAVKDRGKYLFISVPASPTEEQEVRIESQHCIKVTVKF